MHKIPRFGGGDFGLGGGEECRFYFYGRGDFSDLSSFCCFCEFCGHLGIYEKIDSKFSRSIQRPGPKHLTT